MRKYRMSGRRRRGGYTLLELLLASICTLAVVTAGTTMTLAVSYVAQAGSAERIVVSEGHGLERRLFKLIRGCRLIGYRGSDSWVMWTEDVNGDDEIQFSETAVVHFNAADRTLELTTPYAANASPLTIALTDYTVAAVDLLQEEHADAIQAAPEAETTVLAQHVESVALKDNAAGYSLNLLLVKIELREGDQTRSFVVSAAPGAPGDYLTNPTTHTSDGKATARMRRLSVKAWTPPS